MSLVSFFHFVRVDLVSLVCLSVCPYNDISLWTYFDKISYVCKFVMNI